ncbi:hypothetical protein BOTBODRAFT_51169 [Botryobasidium botryosum FD-172 SS1]|uniref:Uncharacterized protein n=1 Tax=Botryobasidium botryosum (strain FD-172 SS1) TaxID=930990 RepID=A0A067N6L4_BOTB1|nr:hypothetical protein BOTBODRAFT_51169 [Botryobasidium botryosum FD-172 SS1]
MWNALVQRYRPVSTFQRSDVRMHASASSSSREKEASLLEAARNPVRDRCPCAISRTTTISEKLPPMSNSAGPSGSASRAIPSDGPTAAGPSLSGPKAPSNQMMMDDSSAFWFDTPTHPPPVRRSSNSQAELAAERERYMQLQSRAHKVEMRRRDLTAELTRSARLREEQAKRHAREVKELEDEIEAVKALIRARESTPPVPTPERSDKEIEEELWGGDVEPGLRERAARTQFEYHTRLAHIMTFQATVAAKEKELIRRRDALLATRAAAGEKGDAMSRASSRGL